MILSERTLKQWRKEALTYNELKIDIPSPERSIRIELNRRILRMTQELLDLHLIKK